MEQMNTRFLPGDKVTVLPYSEISAKFVVGRRLPSGCYFLKEMEKYCECDYIVESVLKTHGGVGYYYLSGANGWSFTDEMLEMSIELSGSVNNNVMSFDEVMNFSAASQK